MNANNANSNLTNNADDVNDRVNDANGGNDANDISDANEQVNSDTINRISRLVTPQIVNNHYQDALFNGTKSFYEDDFGSLTFPSDFP